ncbi:murein L,D-transpeptidase family protein [Bdellovibrio bacteriovorus]|uniref:L,D-transpeptidase family protein n=1 Tax=Bdellovibrio bacteriovorus TaxID=959 RepID=UPI0035A7175E
MKKLIFPLIALTLVSLQSFAGSKATDRSYKYCDDMTQIDKLLDRSRESVERIQREGLNIERIVVSKDKRQLYLVSGDTLLRTYTVAFGWNFIGHKQFQGDGKTPEGIYTIDYKNPKSQFTKSLHVDYPNKADIAYAKSQGKDPGGDIMIHGLPSNPQKYERISKIHPYDWTLGCIAVTNKEIEEIYALVKEKTLVEVCKISPTK